MSGEIEHQMTNCLEQMKQLQDKMKHLQQEKTKKVAEETFKKQEVEPNLKVMSDWLEIIATPDKTGNTFQRTNQRNTQVPTDFMKQYIEATYNTFIIQQKRINDLEKKIELYTNSIIQECDYNYEDPRRTELEKQIHNL